MRKIIDLTGQQFERLRVIERAEDHISPSGRRRIMWLCHCECGNTTTVAGDCLKQGKVKSCGCLFSEGVGRQHTHGMSDTKIYEVWKSVRQRCTNKKRADYSSYGGRGIIVCDEWLHDFQKFYDWSMANGYEEGLSIDRIDVNGNYCPENCRWVSIKTQANNKRNNHYICINGETKTLREWSQQYNVNNKTVSSRLKYGWTPEEALGIVPRNK